MNETAAPLIIDFTPTGMLMSKRDTAYVPVSAGEIIDDVRNACEEGISCVHLHARDPITEEPAWEKEYYEEIILGIRKFAPDLVISVSTSGRVYSELEKRSDVLELTGVAKPDMASLTLSSLNFNKVASVNSPEMIKALAAKMREKQIKPELEIFDLGMANYAKYLMGKGLLDAPCFVNLILGNVAAAQASMSHAGLLLGELPEKSVVVFGGIGNYQLRVNAMAIAMGYGVRVGIEDNIWYDAKRTRLASNMELLRRIKVLADVMERPVCTPGALRTMLQLKGAQLTA